MRLPFAKTAIALLIALATGLAVPGPARALETTAEQAILIDMATDAVLMSKNADARMTPSSMSKLMTAYMVFDRLKHGGLSLNDTFQVSEKAWRKGGSKMFVEVGNEVRVEDLLRGIIIQSGNDASIVVAENIGGSEDKFAEMMTQRAREIGLTGSNFVNATGWPDPGHYMTARDLAILAEHIVRAFPEYYSLYAETQFTWSGITQRNRNPLLYQPDLDADGLKTGHTNAGGYGLTASATEDGRRLILVVNGLKSARDRANESERLLKWGFREFDNYSLFDGGETVTEAEVWLGAQATVPLMVEDPVLITIPRRAFRQMQVSAVFEGPIPAPITQGDRVATLEIAAKGIETMRIPLVAGADVERLGFVGRIVAAIEHILFGGVTASSAQ